MSSFPLKEVKFKRIIKKINKGKLLYVNLYHENKEKLLKHLFKKLPVVVAGGGMVLNPAKRGAFYLPQWPMGPAKRKDGKE